jgi:hypothetical protein
LVPKRASALEAANTGRPFKAKSSKEESINAYKN